MVATMQIRDATRHRFSVDEYLVFADIDPDRETELLDGEVYDLSPEYAPHARLAHQILYALGDVFGRDRAHMAGSVWIDESTLVQPDAFLVVGGVETPSGPWPASALMLAVEISASTSARDRRKAAAYARAGVANYWRYEVATSTLHLLGSPAGGEYATTDSAIVESAGDALYAAAVEYARRDIR